MKKILLLSIFALFILASCDTNPGVSEAFLKYGHREGVTSITVPGWVIGIAAHFADLSDEEQDLLDCIDKVKVLAIENKELNERVDLHQEFKLKINKNNDFEELLTVRDNNENITIFGKMTEDVIHEMVVLVGGEENVMVYVKGELKPEMINDVAGFSRNNNLLSFK